MDNSFDIEINYKGHSMLLPAVLIQTAYSYKIEVDVQGAIVSFEPDEERNFRAVHQNTESSGKQSPDLSLIKALAGRLIELFKDG